MDAKFQALPPLKRFRLLQQLEESKENAQPPISLQLPSKKRKESRISAYYCLPAKKRVWALQPDLASGNPLSPFDLNVECGPSSLDEEMKPNEEKKKIPLLINTNHSDPEDDKGILLFNENADFTEISDHEEQEKERNEDEDDDGIACAVCQSTDGDPTDPIVFCDGCDLMVHTTCYGNPLIKGIPEGDWFCTQCLNSQSDNQSKAFSCCLCPTKGGAMKRTINGLWAHLVCAVLVPEVFFEDPDGREGINCSKVPKRRWEDKCYVCKSRKGCVIQCSEPKCPVAFHVTCGLNNDLCIEYKQGKKKEETIVAGFCKIHTELWTKQQHTGKFKIVAREEHRKYGISYCGNAD